MNDELFRGTARYRDSYPGREEPQPRIYVRFRPAGVDTSFLALIDTGAHFCLLNQTVAHLVDPQLTASLGQFTVRTAYGPVQGNLYLHRITLIADVGESLDIEATVFIPPEWRGPCFLGYAGALDRFYFGFKPWKNQFLFSAP